LTVLAEYENLENIKGVYIMRLLTIFFSLSLFIFSTQLHAKGISIIYNWGSVEVEPIAALPKTERYRFAEGHVDLGFAYKDYSFFYMPFWASPGAGAVIYRQDGDTISYMKVTPIIAAELKADLNRDALTTYHFSPLKHMWGWLVLIGCIGMIYVRNKLMRSQNKTQNPNLKLES
jgi:hypothetical protein